jgi:hypothetical protein
MYYNKYIKYKNKYLQLKQSLDGGSDHIDPLIIQKFTDKELVESRKDDIICLIKKQTCSSMDYISFLNEWLDFKELADELVSNKQVSNKQSGLLIRNIEYKAMNAKVVRLWLEMVNRCIDKKAKLQNFKNHTDLINLFVNKHISAIKDKAYKLNDDSLKILNHAFTRWFFCNQSPAPFSITSILREEKRRGCSLIKEADKKDATQFITVSQHCLAMASHWFRYPPSFLSPSEIDELIVLSLFHDIFYFDDFINHDKRILQLFQSYVHSDKVKKVVGEHLDLLPDNNINLVSKTPLEVLQYEWTQMDWYLTLTTPLLKTDENKDSIFLPIKSFYDHIGRFMETK